MAEQRLEEIRAARLARREQLIAAGMAPYPAEARRTHTAADLREQFEQLQRDSVPVIAVGRVTGIRRHGGVTFIDLTDGTGSFQLQVSRARVPEDQFARLDLLDTGDFIQAAGEVITTERGVPTLDVTSWHVISKSIRPLPAHWFGLKDHESRFRQREVDLLLNPEVGAGLRRRSEIVDWVRRFLTADGYIEVETPILQSIAGGAAALPFTTHHDALDIPLYLRIAPELFLKRLVVGGVEKVFEIGRNFRNEGIDREHNPEFTMLELYWAYADYEDLMDFTETLLETLTQTLFDSTDIEWQGQTVSFARGWQRRPFGEIVRDVTDVDIATLTDATQLADALRTHGVEVPAAATYPKMIDALYKKLVRPTLLQPTLLFDFPVEMAPLAKRKLSNERLAEKFQLVVGGMEVVNAYTELNDPVEQRQRFVEQAHWRAAGDTEAQPVDEAFLRAMEYGMPPCAGLGLGIDRLAMLLTNTASIRDTILFPLLRPEQ